MNWSVDLLDELKNSHKFIFVSSNSDPITVTIKDAPKIWAIIPDAIFQTGYRIAGSPSDIQDLLLEQGYSEADFEELVQTAINKDYKSTEALTFYNQEKSDYDLWHRSIIAANMKSFGVKLTDIMKAVNPHMGQVIPANAKEKLKLISKVYRASDKGTKVSLEAKIAGLLTKGEQNKVLDVSNLQATGLGTRTINRPPENSKKIGAPSLPIVSSDFDHYLLAIRMLPEGESVYHEELVYMANLFGVAYGPSEEKENFDVRAYDASFAPIVLEPDIELGDTISYPVTQKPIIGALDTKIAELLTKHDKVLDVSNLQPSGKGTRIINPPKTKKFGTANLPIVSSDFDHYLLAIQMITNGEVTYQNDLIYMADKFGVEYIPLEVQSEDSEPIILDSDILESNGVELEDDNLEAENLEAENLEGDYLEGEYLEGEYLEGDYLDTENLEGENLEGEYLEADIEE